MEHITITLLLGWKLNSWSSHSSLLTHSPAQIILLGGCVVLVHQLLDNLSAIVKLVQVIREYGLLLKLVQEGFSLPQFVVIFKSSLEQTGDGGVVG